MYGEVNVIAKKKYLQKNEFRYNTNPAVQNSLGEGHTAYVSAKHGHKSKINIITHGKTFYGEPTVKMSKNPNKESKDPRPSRFSVPRWENDNYLKESPKGYWKIHKADRIAIKKFNKKYEKK